MEVDHIRDQERLDSIMELRDVGKLDVLLAHDLQRRLERCGVAVAKRIELYRCIEYVVAFAKFGEQPLGP